MGHVLSKWMEKALQDQRPGGRGQKHRARLAHLLSLHGPAAIQRSCKVHSPSVVRHSRPSAERQCALTKPELILGPVLEVSLHFVFPAEPWRIAKEVADANDKPPLHPLLRRRGGEPGHGLALTARHHQIEEHDH